MDNLRQERLVPDPAVSKLLLLVAHRAIVEMDVPDVLSVPEQIQTDAAEGDLALAERDPLVTRLGFDDYDLTQVLVDVLCARGVIVCQVLDKPGLVCDLEK